MILLSALFGCKEKTSEPPVNKGTEIGKAQLWLTHGNKAKLLNKEDDLSVKNSLTTPFPVIRIDTAVMFQEIEGFGAALTGSSAYLIHTKLNESKRSLVLNDLFNPLDGIGISYLRLTMGASDFSLSDFTYDDLQSGETDFSLEQFTLSQDLDDVVPVLKEIIEVAPGIKLMGSPWSPPAWMKTNGSLVGGKLKADYYAVYADYFVHYIKAMKDQGIIIDAITPQNEPQICTARGKADLVGSTTGTGGPGRSGISKYRRIQSIDRVQLQRREQSVYRSPGREELHLFRTAKISGHHHLVK